jgi:cell cycle protein kinase DBF2
MGFTSPFSTPQGSPSKNEIPPGANDLPNVFENAMKLGPSTPTKGGRAWLRSHSPNKNGKQAADDGFDESTIQQGYNPGSPTKKSNKENTTPGLRLPKESSYTLTQAAKSRQEPYQYKQTTDPPVRGRYNFQRDLTAEELEKLQLPKVKRLANVTQLCEGISFEIILQALIRY